MKEFFNFIIENYAYLSIPFISAFVGWSTNWLAIKMTFYPLIYKGFPPFGWQGIIPSKAKKMAETAVELWTSKLINIKEEFSKIEPKVMAETMEPNIQRLSKEIIDEVMSAQLPLLWKNATYSIKESLYEDVAEQLPDIVAEMMQEIQDDFGELLDLKELAVTTLTQNRDLLNQVFLKCGHEEFKFIVKSGFYFGFIFGLVQMLVWYFFPFWWILPLAGTMVGYLTNYLALELIFRPIDPIKIGKLTVQGLFIKRQKEVSEEYSKIVASKIITTENIFEFIVRGPGKDRMYRIVQRSIENIINKTVGNVRGLVKFIKGDDTFIYIRNIASFRFMQEMPMNIRSVFGYTQDTLDLKNVLKLKMQNLSPIEFEAFLRPVFKEDELTLILVGAFLGGIAGTLQYLFLF